MREVFIEVAVQVIGAILMGIVGIVFAYIGKWMGQTKKLETVSAAMEQLEAVVKNVVGELQQTMVESLKDASVDGKLSQEDIYDLGKLLVAKANEQLSNPASETLKAAGIDIEAMIHSIAEAYIERIKRMNNIITIDGE
ncbi:MAG: hypothetical protein J6S14_19620 [Clostridia bacterium]|nr:hypothetical protein [Clostridia bacterium]